MFTKIPYIFCVFVILFLSVNFSDRVTFEALNIRYCIIYLCLINVKIAFIDKLFIFSVRARKLFRYFFSIKYKKKFLIKKSFIVKQNEDEWKVRYVLDISFYPAVRVCDRFFSFHFARPYLFIPFSLLFVLSRIDRDL